MKKFITVTLILGSFNAFANSGEKALFTMEKDHNEENIMMIHAQTDKNCKFITSRKNSEKNYMEFYWLMNNGRSKKEIHPMIRSTIKERVQFLGINNAKDSFKIKLHDLTELRHDLSDTTMEITSEIVNGECQVKSILTLGASGRYRRIDLDQTFCRVSKNFFGVPDGCRSLDLIGKDIQTDEKVKVTFKAR